MTLQWTFVATCLYVEIFVIVLLLLPFISPPRWQKVFRSRLLANFKSYANLSFNIFIAILLLLFFESVREVRKYSEPLDVEDLKHHPEAENLYHMKLFRAQRNLYIAGFALFLWLIIKRLVVLIATEASLMAESQAARRQAESATNAAQQMLNEKDNTRNDKREDSDVKGDKDAAVKEDKAAARDAADLKKTQEQLENTKEDLYHAKLEFESMKKQAESVTKEYDRLLEEHSKLQKKLAIVEGSGEGTEAKKDN